MKFILIIFLLSLFCCYDTASKHRRQRSIALHRLAHLSNLIRRLSAALHRHPGTFLIGATSVGTDLGLLVGTIIDGLSSAIDDAANDPGWIQFPTQIRYNTSDLMELMRVFSQSPS